MSSPDTVQKNEEEYEVTLDEAFELAKGHHASGNYILAERTYRDILRAVPDHYPTTQYLGILLFQSGNYEDALTYLGLALQEEPENAQCLNNYGGALAQLGRHEEALEYYAKALEVNPDYLDCLNNKAYACWSLEQYKEAERLSREALDIDPDNTVSLNGLAMALAKLVKFEEAIDLWERASTINPDEPMFLVNWGNTLREMGRLKDSEKICKKALELSPENPEALNNLANALRDTGKTEEAIALYRQATDIRPDYHEAHANLGIAYIDSQMYGDAAVAARYAVAFDRNFAMGYNVLSHAYCELGDFPSAHSAAQRAIHLRPNDAEPYLELANVLTSLDQYDDAQAAVQQALKHERGHARAFLKLADIRDRMRDREGALKALEEGLEISPNMTHLWLRKAHIYLHNNESEKALDCIEEAIKIAPHSHVVYQTQAETLISLNRNKEAEEAVRKAISLKDNVPAPYSTLASLKKFESEDDPDFIKMLDLADKVKRYGRAAEMNYHYGMSDIYEQLKKYDDAFEHLQIANDLRRKTIHYIHREDRDYAKAIKSKYTPDFIAMRSGLGFDSESPVFIVGMPRSGTTLTEQIISSHPDVCGAGELSELGDVFRQMGGTLRVEELAKIGQEYVERVKSYDKSGKALRITDKMPANYMNVGLIALILPNAKIIHCRRNPIDTCLSCYKQNFARGQYWSYDLEELGDEYLKYLDIMEHWRTVLPGKMLEIEYEETVGNFEEQARKLIDFVGLPWDDACLEPHKQKRAVLTASKAQVTKPVYQSSVEKWRRYEAHLQPLVRKLLSDQAMSEEALAEFEAKRAEAAVEVEKEEA